MNEGESVREMEVRFSHLISHLTALGQTYNQRDQVRKILGGLSKEWEAKVTAIEETKGESMGSVTALFGSLAEYESKMKYRNDLKEKKKGIALKAQDSDDDEDPDDEEIGLLVKKFRKFYKNKATGRRFTSRKTPPPSESREQIICYECGKPGHIRTECPQLTRKEKKKEQFSKKKAFVSSIWGDDSSGSSDEEDCANICLVAREDDSETDEVINVEPTYDELLSEYDSLRSEFIKIAKDLVASKKKIKSLEEKLREIPDASLKCEKCEEAEKKSTELAKTLQKFTKGSEMLDIILGNQRCFSDKSGLGYNPCLDKKKGKKKNGQKAYLTFFKHSVHSPNPYAHCSFCNHKGHSTSSCYYKKKRNLGNMKWVPKGTYLLKTVYTNDSGPKKRWVPKER